MSKNIETIEHIFPDAVVDEPSEGQFTIEQLSAKNGALLEALNDTLTDTHLVDKRISDLLSDLAEWNHDGDAEEAGAFLARNEHIVDQVADLIEEHIAIGKRTARRVRQTGVRRGDHVVDLANEPVTTIASQTYQEIAMATEDLSSIKQ